MSGRDTGTGKGRNTMRVYGLEAEARFDPRRHVERILGEEAHEGFTGDHTVACWEPGQVSPYHCHPEAVEIYLCLDGGGIMRTPDRGVEIVPGSFVVHPPGELHEFENGPRRTLLFRVRYGKSTLTRRIGWRGHPEHVPTPEDLAYFERNPPGLVFDPDGPSV